MRTIGTIRNVLSKRWSVAQLIESFIAATKRRDVTPLRVHWKYMSRPLSGSQGGNCAFPFGMIEFVHAAALYSQYKEIFLDGSYDIDLPSDAVVIDCGGHIGLATIRIKQRQPGSRITVFEADPTIAETLRRNLASCGIYWGITIHAAAAWIEDGLVPFSSNGSDGGRLSPDGKTYVQAVCLADYIPGTVHLLKLDIEGAEYEVIRHLAHRGKLASIQAIACELHVGATDQGRLVTLLATLHEHGFCATLAHAESAPFYDRAPAPFKRTPSAAYIAHLYAWKQTSGSASHGQQ